MFKIEEIQLIKKNPIPKIKPQYIFYIIALIINFLTSLKALVNFIQNGEFDFIILLSSGFSAKIILKELEE